MSEADLIAPCEADYLSKSRLMAYVKNPRHFYFTYVEGLREPENRYMRRGSRIHLAFEKYYENVERLGRRPRLSELISLIPSDVLLWADFTEPYISNFLLFEARRLAASESFGEFCPVAIEEEVWMERPPVDGSPPWMGFADVIFQAASVPEIETDEGVVIVDFKTGKSKNALKYQDQPGNVLDELEYYAMLFESEYEVAALGGYYPRDDVFLMDERDDDRRERLIETIEEMVSLDTEMESYPQKPGPLCKWRADPDCQYAFYEKCNCGWGTAGGPGPTY